MKIGDVVWLKSGGPAMTVIDFSVDGYNNPTSVKCQWLGYDGPPIDATFNALCLTYQDPDK